jgi:kanamycin kinase
VTEPVIAEIPTGPVEVPPAISAVVGTAELEPVWRNELGGLTFRAVDGSSVRYAKWVAAGTPELDLMAEAERLAWASTWIPVPTVVEVGADEDGAWLVTEDLGGQSAVSHRWCREPAVAAAAIGHGLRQLHDRLPVDPCPFDWSVTRRLQRADVRVADGEGPSDWSPEHRHLTLDTARARLGEPPAVDRLVVCHGDACAPNTLLRDDGTFAGHVDLGSLGVADRWADIAVATWSLNWNFTSSHEPVFYAAYGIDPDPERIAYYRLLWDLA